MLEVGVLLSPLIPSPSVQLMVEGLRLGKCNCPGTFSTVTQVAPGAIAPEQEPAAIASKVFATCYRTNTRPLISGQQTNAKDIHACTYTGYLFKSSSHALCSSRPLLSSKDTDKLRRRLAFFCLNSFLHRSLLIPSSDHGQQHVFGSRHRDTGGVVAPGFIAAFLFDTVRAGVRSAISREPRMGASLLRLFFHDCFVNGCDGGILLEDTGSFVGEQNSAANRNSARGYNVISSIKAQVDRACGGISPVVSCSDILAIAARDSVVELGGPSYPVPLGRRDARTANGASTELPRSSHSLDEMIGLFGDKGFTPRELVALSGAHTVGLARCVTFRTRIYNGSNIDPAFAATRQATCSLTAESNDNLAPLDPQSPNRFGNNYFQALMNRRGLLQSDQVLFNGGSTDSVVMIYSDNAAAFSTDFANAMVKMGNLGPLTGTQGEIRVNCARVN
ncbi:hypothetical protein ACLOJK_001417 [Asimina triloba]